jgi:hypothetical protein
MFLDNPRCHRQFPVPGISSGSVPLASFGAAAFGYAAFRVSLPISRMTK